MKNYIGFSRDHSRSMTNLARAAARDYNNTIAAIKDAAVKNNQDTIVSTVKCGVDVGGMHGIVERETINSSIAALNPIAEGSYRTNGSRTPLFDSVNELISILQDVPDANDPDVAFLVQTITDGEENASKIHGSVLAEKIRKLQATDRWTFVFRVPRGAKRTLVNYGIPAGNILEWDQTEEGLEAATYDTVVATQSFYEARSRGVKSTKSFYSNIADVKPSTIAKTAREITKEVKFHTVGPKDHDTEIFDFCMKKVGSYKKGCAFYELSKTENAVQDYKMICIRNKTTQKVYSGAGTRTILGLPEFGTIKLIPGDHGDYDIFIQSTSTNRKVKEGTRVLYWASVNS